MCRALLMIVSALVVALPATVALAAKPTKSSLTIDAKPNPVVFGSAVTVSGNLASKATGVTVSLQALPHPYTGGYSTVGTATTTANGAYSLNVTPTRGTRYRTVAKTSPDVTSPEVTVAVARRVGFIASDTTPRRGILVRFRGSVRPANAGATALIQKLTSTGWKTVVSTTLKATSTSYSSYVRRVRVSSSASYRVRVSGSGAYATGTSRVRVLTVH